MLFSAFLLCLSSSPLQASASPSDHLASAQSAFSSASSPADFQKAALAFEELLKDLQNPELHFNAGNAWFRAGDLGRTFLHYRRALRLSPSYAEAKANLAAARRKRLDQADPESPSVLERLAFWHNLLSARSKFQLAFWFWILLWVCLLARLLKGYSLPFLRGGEGGDPHPPSRSPIRKPSPLRLAGTQEEIHRLLAWLSSLSLAVFLALSASLAVQLFQESRRPSAVILAPETPLRIGGGDRYDLAVKESLHAGAEVRVLEIRPGWCRVRLNAEITGWVPSETMGLIP